MSLAYVFEGAKGDCTNCPCDCKNYDNCPLIELDSTEEKDGYYKTEHNLVKIVEKLAYRNGYEQGEAKGRADEITKFKEWFDEYTSLENVFTFDFDDVITLINKYEKDIDYVFVQDNGVVIIYTKRSKSNDSKRND